MTRPHTTHMDHHVTHCRHCGAVVIFYTPEGTTATLMLHEWLHGVTRGKCKKCWVKAHSSKL